LYFESAKQEVGSCSHSIPNHSVVLPTYNALTGTKVYTN